MYFNNTLNSDPHTFNQYKPNPCNFNDLQAMIAHFSQPIFKKPLNPQSIVIDSAEGKGKWTVSEQKCYIKFIQANMEEMRCRIKRKSEKVFLQMSKLVKTRSADQCRSHHQKILKYHSNLQEIIRFYTEEMFGETVNIEVKKDAMSKQATTFEIKDDLYTLFQDGNKIKLQINCDLIDEY